MRILSSGGECECLNRGERKCRDSRWKGSINIFTRGEVPPVERRPLSSLPHRSVILCVVVVALLLLPQRQHTIEREFGGHIVY